MKVQFKLKDWDEMTSANILWRSGKAKWIYKNAWNSKLSNGSIRSTDYNKDISSFEPSPTWKNDKVEEVYCSEIYLTEKGEQLAEAKIKELNNWKQQYVIKEEDVMQQYISIRWVISRKVINGRSITKARLCARGFEETQGFPTDLSCSSRISVWSLFTLIASSE